MNLLNKKSHLNIEIINNIELIDMTQINSFYINKSFKKNCEVLGTGDNATVYGYKNYAIKVFKKKCIHSNDHKNLLLLQGHPSFPKLYYSLIENNNYIITIMERINGISFFDLDLNFESIYLIEMEIEKIEEAMKYAFKNYLFPHDVHIDNVVISTEGKVFIVDVGSFYSIEDNNLCKKASREIRFVVDQFFGQYMSILKDTI